MDIASKIKIIKQEVQSIDDETAIINKRIAELKSLIDEKKKKEQKLQDLIRLEQEMLALLE